MSELHTLTLAEAARQVRDGDVTSRQLTKACLARIEAIEPKLNAFITLMADDALAAADRADSDLAAGNNHGPLHGVPVAVKDLCETAGVRTTAGSKILEDWIPDRDATVVENLRDGGAIILGKLNLHEFAFGVTSDNAHYGAVHNPWDLERHPGGSSGGSGAAVASSMCFGAIGTDTGGSIRIPASVCGTVGLMPTYGLVSRVGVVPLSWSLDHVGPLARTVEDAALFLNVLQGYDPEDATSLDPPGFDANSEIGQPVAGMKVGVVRSQFEKIEPGVTAAVEAALNQLKTLGVGVSDVQIPMMDAGLRLNVLGPEAAAFHIDWLRERPQDYSDSVRSSLQSGLMVAGHEYVNDLRRRTEFTAEVEAAMQGLDALVTPTCPAVASKIDESRDGAFRFAALTSPWDHTGQPVLSVPCGFGEHDMPVGLSFAGRPLGEATLCRLGHAYEQATEWHLESPDI